MSHLSKNFIAPALPLPSAEYRQQEATELARALRLYFTQLDGYINDLTEEVYAFSDAPAYVAVQDTLVTGIDDTAFVPLVSIRLNLGPPVPSIFVKGLVVAPVAAGGYEAVLIKNPTLSGESWDIGVFPNAEVDLFATAVSDGEIIRNVFVGATGVAELSFNGPGNRDRALQLEVSSGVSDIYTVAIRMTSGSGGSATGSLSFYDVTG
jgi:hypothetical protein